MAQILERGPVEHKDIVRISGLTDLELSKTSRENFRVLSNSRLS